MLIPAILALLGLVGLILSVTSGLITAGVDGLFAVLVCLITMLIFGGLAIQIGIQEGRIPVPSRFRGSHK